MAKSWDLPGLTTSVWKNQNNDNINYDDNDGDGNNNYIDIFLKAFKI